MKIYLFDDQGYYTGESSAEKDQISRDEEYILPAKSTLSVPPDLLVGETAKWDGEKWVVVDDPVYLEQQKKLQEEVLQKIEDQKNEAEIVLQKQNKATKLQEIESKITTSSSVDELKNVIAELLALVK